MARVKRSVHSKKHRRKILEKAEGYRGTRSRSVRKDQRKAKTSAGSDGGQPVAASPASPAANDSNGAT